MTDHAHLVERLQRAAITLINRGDAVLSEVVLQAVHVIEEQDVLLRKYAEVA